jgi:hypothetical protein
MKILPDQTDVVSTDDGDARIAWMPALQPDESGLARARVTLGPGRLVDGIRQLLLTEQGWTDVGIAPSLRSEEWHPELPEDLGEAIALTRKVMASIPGCTKVLVAPEIASKSSGFRVGSGALFYQQSEDGYLGLVPEHLLDRTPFVRAVERMGEAFAEWLRVLPHDDGSGVAGEVAIDVSATGLSITYDDESDGGVLSLTSELVDDEWRHRTTLRMPIYQDAVGILRTLREPLPEISSFASESEIWGPIMRDEPVVEVEIENNVLTVSARPGTLLRDRD